MFDGSSKLSSELKPRDNELGLKNALNGLQVQAPKWPADLCRQSVTIRLHADTALLEISKYTMKYSNISATDYNGI